MRLRAYGDAAANRCKKSMRTKAEAASWSISSEIRVRVGSRLQASQIIKTAKTQTINSTGRIARCANRSRRLCMTPTDANPAENRTHAQMHRLTGEVAASLIQIWTDSRR